MHHLTRWLALLLLLAPAALAGPTPEEAARGLLEGTLSPVEVAAAWEEARLRPDRAARLVRELLPDLAPPPGRALTAELADRTGRRTVAHVRVPEAAAADGRYGVLVLLHGIGGGAAKLVDLVAPAVPPHTIVIAPESVGPPADEQPLDLALAPRLDGKFTRQWWSYGEQAFPLLSVDWLARRYPLDRDRVLLVGVSMGGFGTWNLGLRFHDRFAGLAVLAGGISRQEFALDRDRATRRLLDNARMVPSFLIHGDEDDVVPVRFARTIVDDLRALRAEHVYEEVAGGRHDPATFDAALLGRLREWLAARRRAPHPERVLHRVVRQGPLGAGWVRAEAIQGDTAHLTARAHERANAIEVTTTGVTRLTVFLDPELVKPDRKLRLVVDGAVHEGRVRPSLLAVAESFAWHRDPARVYEHMLTVDVAPRGEEGAGGGGSLEDLRKLGEDLLGPRRD